MLGTVASALLAAQQVIPTASYFTILGFTRQKWVQTLGISQQYLMVLLQMLTIAVLRQASGLSLDIFKITPVAQKLDFLW